MIPYIPAELGISCDETGFMSGLVVHGPYYLLWSSNCNELPTNMVIHGWLNIVDTKITELPADLVVHGCLHFKGLGMTAIPPTVVVKGKVYGLV